MIVILMSTRTIGFITTDDDSARTVIFKALSKFEVVELKLEVVVERTFVVLEC